MTRTSGVKDLADLHREITEIKEQNGIKPDEAFIVWFLRAFTARVDDGDAQCIAALTGGKNDRNIDAVYIDHQPQIVFVVQGKYRTTPLPHAETRSDILAFAQLSQDFLGPPEDLLAQADASIKDRLREAHRCLRRGYRLHLQYATTGTVSPALRDAAERRIAGNAQITILDRRDIAVLVADYLEGAAPPIPSLDLPVQGEHVFNRYDPISKLSSWVFTMSGQDLAAVHDRLGSRLFARNIRGFLGMKTPVNEAMLHTITSEPAKFWYFNNGVTMVSDKARQVTERGRQYLRLQNPQIINGQQTTRVLSSLTAGSGRPGDVSVLVKLLEIPREQHAADYGGLISGLVAATNFQNAISSSDLQANDLEQVRIDRELRKLGYVYLRKRQTKAEARANLGRRRIYFIKKEELARAIGSCLLPPEFWRRGKRQLWEHPVYEQIFDGKRTAADYLTFYWLDRQVRRCARGDVRKGYAVYMLLNFLWRREGASFRRRDNARRLSAMAEHERDRNIAPAVTSLDHAVSSLMSAALAFFRANARIEAGQLDEASFFRRPKLVEDFARFWDSDENRHHERFLTEMSRFWGRLAEIPV